MTIQYYESIYETYNLYFVNNYIILVIFTELECARDKFVNKMNNLIKVLGHYIKKSSLRKTRKNVYLIKTPKKLKFSKLIRF